jgi:Mrp family chromosome partitioning ATPase/capsular polysaccharide biosynthesis protein
MESPATPSGSSEPASVSANLLTYLGVLARRKWIMLPALVLTPLVAVALEMQKPAVYQSTAQMFLNRSSLAASLAGVDVPATPLDVERFANTQAKLAREPEVARRAVAAAKLGDGYDLLGASEVSSDPEADVLYFTVRGRDPTRTQALATAYAQQFVAYRSEIQVAANDRALKSIQQRLVSLRAAGGATSSLYAELVAKKSQLELLNALYTTDASLVRPADGAAQIGPRPPARTATLGLGFGVALAIALAFLAEALDTRVKTLDELEEGLQGLPTLGRLPDPAKEVNEGTVAMLTDPASRYAESVRMLRVRLSLATREQRQPVIMVTSAHAREGKSTTAANVAVALAQSGVRVVLCDLDARRPMIHQLFKLPMQPGLTDVAVGDVDLADALTSVPLPRQPYWHRRDSRNGHGPGSLEVLTLGRRPSDPGEFTGSERVLEILESLRDRADVVLIDTAAMLAVGDAMTIGGVADAVLVVVRFGVARRSSLRDLTRALWAFPAAPLGFVTTGSVVGDRYEDDWYYRDPGSLADQRESIQR